MIKAMVMAVCLAAGSADGGSGSIMFDQQKPALEKAAVKKAVEKMNSGSFSQVIAIQSLELAQKFTEKLGVETTVKNVLISPAAGKTGADALDMAVVVFTNEKSTFALVFVNQGDKIGVLPRDFTAL